MRSMFAAHPRLVWTMGGLVLINVLLYRGILRAPVLTISVIGDEKERVVLVQTPHDRVALINAGPDAGIARALGTRLSFWERQIDLVVFTNASVGSTGGLPTVLDRYRVNTLARFGARGSYAAERTFATAARARPGPRIIPVRFGMTLVVDRVRIEILSTNNPSTATIAYGSSSFIISSSTPGGRYVSNGRTAFTKTSHRILDLRNPE